MTRYEEMLMRIMITEIPNIRKTLEKINSNLEKLNDREVDDEHTCNET